MKNLSQRATEFLKRQNRSDTFLKREEIIDFFNSQNIPLFEPIIDFQENYSGYAFYWGLETVMIRLIIGGGFPFNKETAYVECEKTEEGDNEYFFFIADEELPMTLKLDEFGKYYEGNKCVNSSFDKLIERFAIGEEIDNRYQHKDIKEVAENKNPKLYETLNLDLIPEASDEYIQWYKNESIYLKQSDGIFKIISSK